MLMDSASRHSIRAPYWEGSWPLIRVVGFDWITEEIAEHLAEGVPAASWLALATAWLRPAQRR